MAQTNVQAFSGDVEISSDLVVNTDDLFVDTVNSRVGIGTDNPGLKLEVLTGNGANYGLRLRRGSGAAFTDLGHLSTPGTEGLAFNVSDGISATQEVMRVTGTGRVGVGTDTPRAKMDIFTGSTTTAGIILDRYATGNYRSELYQASNGLSIHVGNASTAPSEKLLIHHDGTVTATTFSGALDGNADTATTLETTRTINGVDFNGSENIVVEPYISSQNTGDTSCYLVFTQDSTNGYKRLYEDSGLYYDNTNNQLYSGAHVSSEGGFGMRSFQIKIRQTNNVNYYQLCGYIYAGSHKVFMTALPNGDSAFANNHFSGLVNKGRYGPANWTDGLNLGYSRYDNSLGTYPVINWYVQNQGQHARVALYVSLYNAATNNNAFYFNVGTVGLQSHTLAKSYTNQW